ncbi:MAG TPA: magnesium transporter CorA family protein [Ktedonobacterales bacterium]
MSIQPTDLPAAAPDLDAGAVLASDDEHVTLIAEAADVPIEQGDVIALEEAFQELQPSVAAYLFQPDVAPSLVKPETLPDLVSQERNFVWVDLTGYTPEEMQNVARLLSLHSSGVQATLSVWQRPRLDLFDNHFFVTATIPAANPQAYRVEARRLSLFVGHNFLVSVHRAPLPFVRRAFARANNSPDLLPHDSAFMLYILLDELVGYYEQMHAELINEIEGMEERALRDTTDDFLEDLLHFKRYVFAVAQLADQHRPIFAAFLRPDFRWVPEADVVQHFRDLEERLWKLGDDLLAAKDATNGTFDIYVSHMSHRTNNIMKVLTLVSTVLLPASVILGFFGTSNLQSVPFLTSTGGFMLMVVTVLAVCTTALYIFRHQGWL